MLLKITLVLILFVCSPRSYSWNLENFSSEVSSPWKTEAKTPVIVGAGLTAAAILLEDQIDLIHDDFVDDRPLGSLSTYGDLAGKLYPNLIYIIGQGVSGYRGEEKGYSRAIGMFKASAYALSTTTILKPIVQEPRPDNHEERDSFPSGHSTSAFAFGGYVLSQHGWFWGGPALAISTLSALSRINDNRHRLHDVIAGATIGLGYGLGIGYMGKTDDNVTKVSIVPIYQGDIKAIACSWNY